MRYLLNILLLSFLFAACTSEKQEDNILPSETPDQSPIQVVDYGIYNLEHFINNGSIQFQKNEQGAFVIEVTLDHAFSLEQLEVDIYENSIADKESQKIITLEPIQNGENRSINIVDKTDEGEEISFEELLSMNTHLQIAYNNEVLYFSELGENALNGNTKTYHLLNPKNNDIDAVYTLYERTNGSTFGFFKMNTTFIGSDVSLPTVIRKGNYASKTNRTVVELFDYNPSEIDFYRYTSFSETVNGEPITFEELNNNDYHVITYEVFDEESLFVTADMGTSEKTDSFESGRYIDLSTNYMNGSFKVIKRADGTALIESELKELGTPNDKQLTLQLYDHKNDKVIPLGMLYITHYITSFSENNIQSSELSITYEEVINGDYSFYLLNQDGEQLAIGKLYQ